MVFLHSLLATSENGFRASIAFGLRMQGLGFGTMSMENIPRMERVCVLGCGLWARGLGVPTPPYCYGQPYFGRQHSFQVGVIERLRARGPPALDLKMHNPKPGGLVGSKQHLSGSILWDSELTIK